MSDKINYGAHARLFPTVKSDEDRATSVFLACLNLVYEFRRDLMHTVGRRVSKRGNDFKATVHPKFGGRYSPEDIPDGLLEHSKTGSWRAAIEVKIKKTDLNQDQLERYLGRVVENKLQALITISNEMCANPARPPLRLASSDKKLRKVPHFHWSWKYISHTAEKLLLDDGVSDPIQRTILEEFLLFLQDSKSGVEGFTVMNQGWTDFVDDLKVRGTPEIQSYEDAVSDWHQESAELAIIIARKFNAKTTQLLSNDDKKSSENRLKNDVDLLRERGDLYSEFDIDGVDHPLRVTLDVDQRSLRISMRHELSDKVKTPHKRIERFLRQFKDDNDEDRSGKHEHMHIFAKWPYLSEMTNTTLFDAIQRMVDGELQGSKLIRDDKDSIQYVDLTYSPMGVAGDMRSRKKIISTIESRVRFFCEHYVDL